MANFRAIPTKMWADDTFLSMSPEQKLIFIYLHTSPYVTQCGIYQLQIKTMGFHLGYTSSPIESALTGFCAAFPDFAAWDRETGEIALLQYPNLFLKDAPQKIWNYVVKELSEVQSMMLLKKVIEKSSATTSKPYLSRLRAINMEIQNQKRDDVNTLLDIDLIQDADNQNVTNEIEKKRKEKEKKEKEPAHEKPTIEKEVNYINAHEIARVEFLRRYLDLNPDWENKCFVEPYFENLQKKGEWFALQVPTNANDLQKWIGKHYAGINSWASNEHKFWKNKKAANPTTQQQKNGAEPTITIGGIPVPLSVYQLYQSENG